MTKRFFDISFPPKKEGEKKKEEVFEKKDKQKNTHFPPSDFSFQKKTRIKLPKVPVKKIFLVFLIFFPLFLFWFSNVKFSKAEIQISPAFEEIKTTEKISVFTNIDNSDFKNKILPGKIFEKEMVFSDQFEATGRTLQKAEGIIRLYNKYTTQEEVWAAGTRFISSEGKVFKSKDKIIVPPAKIQNGKIEPSFVDVPVIAAEGGKEYNIGPSYFSVLAFKGSPRFDKYEGKSTEPMKGGGEVLEVKKEDLENGEKILMERINGKMNDILKNEVSSDFQFLLNNFSVEKIEKKSSAKEGDKVEKFNLEIKVRVKTIIFKKEEVLRFTENLFLSQIPKEKELDKKSIQLEFEGENFNLEKEKMSFLLKASAKTFYKFDVAALKKGIAGKKINEAKMFLTLQPGISRIKINIFPFWIKKIPEDLNKIKIIYPQVD